MSVLDEAAVERAAAGLRLRLPRAAQRGKVGEVCANSIGSSIELHDFRQYQPGDDPRHIDWNAVARTGEVILRVRREEVSPRVELLVDASRSMAVSPEKDARAREVALFFCVLATRAGLDTVLLVAGADGQKCPASNARSLLRGLEMSGRDALGAALHRLPPLRSCGLRVVVSDFLFESPVAALTQRLAHGAAKVWLVQVLDREDWDPSGGVGARLVDAESAATLDRVLARSVIEDYKERFGAHQKMWRDAARRTATEFVTISAEQDITAHARGALACLTEST